VHRAALLGIVFEEPTGEGWGQVVDLTLAFVLSSLIGLERELRHKSAGLRTHALVGLGAALFVLVSKYGFTDVLRAGRVVLDPSRVAAQIASGIGFIGAGLIFVHRQEVRGLTTAAVVWVTAAVGAACGAGLPVLAAYGTAVHLAVVVGYPPLVRRLPRSRYALSAMRVTYEDGGGHLRTVLAQITARGFTVAELSTASIATGGRDGAGEDGAGHPAPRQAEVTLLLQGSGSINELSTELSELDGVLSVAGVDANDVSE
jgi:putative Mg2+ transporter-C (MgtC) family protein